MYCGTLNGVPIFEKPPPKYYAFEIMRILRIDEDRIAKQRPLQTHCSSTFVVDITQLSHPDDIKKENVCTRGHTQINFNAHTMKITKGKVAPGASGPNVYCLRQLHGVHPSNKDFRSYNFR